MPRSAPLAPSAKASGRKSAPRGRAEKSAARRDAILEAALEEFSARGYEATRIDDVAQRAGVAKGTIYLHFEDKEALFQELVRVMLFPIVGALEAPIPPDMPIRKLLDAFIDLFVREVYGTKRRAVLRLVTTVAHGFRSWRNLHLPQRRRAAPSWRCARCSNAPPSAAS